MPSHLRTNRAAKNNPGDGKSTWKRVLLVMAVLMLVVGGSAYAYISRPDPALARIADLRSQMEGADDAQRRELRNKMGEEYKNLSPESREALRDEWETRWAEREQKQLAEFFALSPAEQIKKLDEEIKRDEERRKEWEKRRAQRSNDSGGNRSGMAGNMGGGDRGGRGGRSRDASDPNARSKRYLDKTPAPTRAMRAEYRRMREERRKKMGIASRR